MRKFILPTLSLLTLTGGTACSGPTIVGDWFIESITYDGGWQMQFPDRHTEGPYFYTRALTMRVNDDGSAEVKRYNCVYDSNTLTGWGSFAYFSGVWEKLNKGEFTLDFTENELDMNCTLEDEELDCDRDGDTIIIVQEWRPPPC